MSAVLFPNSGGLRCTPTGFSPFKLAPAKSIISRRDGTPLYFLFQGGLHPSSGSSIRCEGNRRGRPRRNNLSDKTVNEAEQLKEPISDGGTSKSSSQEEIIALFRRIQSSISKGELKVSKKRSPNNLKGNKSAESVLGTLRKYPTRKQVRAPNQEENRKSSHSRGTAEEQILEDAPLSTPSRGTAEDKRPEDAPLSGDFKVSRPMSKFVKRSPIPPPSVVKENIRGVVETQSPTVVGDEGLELQKLNEMKLSELKTIAKTKGVKGYSKLKKGEILELLKGLLQSSS